jgi:hypothetical protein
VDPFFRGYADAWVQRDRRSVAVDLQERYDRGYNEGRQALNRSMNVGRSGVFSPHQHKGAKELNLDLRSKKASK